MQIGPFNISWGRKSAYYTNTNGVHGTFLTTDQISKLIGKYKGCLSSGHSDANMMALFLSIPEVFAPIDGIASRAANGVFQVRKVATDEIVYDNKWLNKVLTIPNPGQSFSDLVYNAVVYRIIGNRYLYAKVPDTMTFNYKNLTSLYLLPPQRTEIKPKSSIPDRYSITSTGDLVDYYQVSNFGRVSNIKPEFVLHEAYLTLSDYDTTLKGFSPLCAAEYPMSNLMAVYEARNIIYVKQGAIGAVVNRKKDDSGTVAMTTKEKKDIREEVDNTYGITGGRSPLAITDVPIDFIRFVMSIKELMPFEETQASALAVAGVLKFPRELLPQKDGATYANQQGAERNCYQNAAIPEGKLIAQAITRLLKLEESGLYIDVSYDHIEALQEDKKQKAEVDQIRSETYTALYEKGHITKNQLLVGLGMEEVENGDVYITDNKNPDPLAVKLGVGGTAALQAVLVDTNLSTDAKRNALIVVFGLSPEDAAKLVIEKQTTNDPAL